MGAKNVEMREFIWAYVSQNPGSSVTQVYDGLKAMFPDNKYYSTRKYLTKLSDTRLGEYQELKRIGKRYYSLDFEVKPDVIAREDITAREHVTLTPAS